MMNRTGKKIRKTWQHLKQGCILVAAAVIISAGGCSLYASYGENKDSDKGKETKAQTEEPIEAQTETQTGQNPVMLQGQAEVSEEDRTFVEEECSGLMKKLKKAQKDGDVAEEALVRILGADGTPAFSISQKLDLVNYGKVELFLEQAEQGMPAQVKVYELHMDGGMGWGRFQFDGDRMTYLYANCSWNDRGDPVISDPVCTVIEEWNYTEKGWFAYKLSVPEPPQVSEVIDSWEMLRVKPKKAEFRDMEEKYLRPVGYMGNNLFLTDWDLESLEKLDFTGVYEYLYFMKNGTYLVPEDQGGEVLKEEFEAVIQSYIPIGSEELECLAGYEPGKEVYPWVRLGCGTYISEIICSGIPEITEIRDNGDGTQTWAVDTVCESVGEDKVYTHEVLVRLTQDGGIQYLGNHCSEESVQRLMKYRFRLG